MMQNPNHQHDSIIIAGIVLIIFEAIVLIIYFVASDPILSVLEGIFSLSTVSEMGTYSPIILTVFNVMFAIAFITPIVYFFVWVYKKEHGFQFGRVY